MARHTNRTARDSCVSLNGCRSVIALSAALLILCRAFNQPGTMQAYKIPPSKVIPDKFVGKGGFGTVFSGLYHKDSGAKPLPVKLSTLEGCLEGSLCVRRMYRQAKV